MPTESTVINPFAREEIPDSDSLYKFVNKAHIRDGIVIPSMVFKDIEGGMSTDWSKYSTPDQTKNRTKNPANNGVIQLSVKSIRETNLKVEHSPLPTNQAHAEVFGEKTQEIQIALSRLYNWCIACPD